MSAGQVIQSFLTTSEKHGIEAAQVYLDNNLLYRQPGLPDGGKQELVNTSNVLKRALPDYQWGVTSMEVRGNTVDVNMCWNGTHDGIYELSKLIPGAPDVPATHKRVAVDARIVFTVEGDLITIVDVQKPLNRKRGSLLAQIWSKGAFPGSPATASS